MNNADAALIELRQKVLKKRVEQRVRDRSSVVAIPLVRLLDRGQPLSLSWAQQRLWFLAQLDQDSDAYQIPFGIRLSGSLDRSALRRSLDTIWARHEALRTIFATHEGQPQASLLPATDGFTLIEHDLQQAFDAPQRLQQIGVEETHTPFDLSRGPLIRGRLIRLADNDHVLLITKHHIVSDGWSSSIFFSELSTLYRAFTAGQDDPLPPLAIQYPDYAAWQRQWLSGERLQKQADYWRHQLADVPVLLELPSDRPRPERQSFAGASLGIRIDAELTRGLKRLSQQHGTTLFMILLAAWAAVLARLSGQQDLVIGTPTANRSRQELEGLIGFFVNTLALRIDLSAAPTLAELIARVRQTALDAQDHQDLPFEQIVEIAQPHRSLAHTPLFQVMFAWQNNDRGHLDLPGLQFQPFREQFDTVKFDLDLILAESADGIAGSIRYATALFDTTTIERHRGYFLAVLKAMFADVNQPVATIDLLSLPEKELLLHSFNQTQAAYPTDRCIHELFEQQVEKTPDAIAVIQDDIQLTYAELNAQANRLARRLIAAGVRPDSRVAICVDRRPHMVVGLLAILKAGGAYVPLDPAYPQDRLLEVLADAQPVLLLVDEAGRQTLGSTVPAELQSLSLDEPLPALPGTNTTEPHSNPDPRALGLTSSHLAYVIYTSGSTGKPKGVMIEHRGVANLWAGLEQAVFQGRGYATVALNASFQFDASVKVLIQLLSGRRLVLVTSSVRMDAAALLRYLAAHQVDLMDCTPSQLESLLAHDLLDSAQQWPRALWIGGEPIAQTAWSQLSTAGHKQFYNVYGPTECTVDSTVVLVNRASGAPTIGHPIANTRLYLLDAHQQPVPLGAVGELYIGGAGVARGYLNRPELTAERFLIDPFCNESGGRLYRTGDLARYRPDGNIEFLGRIDHQVKIRGFRIEPGEIEARLSAHPLVRETVVLAREDIAGDKRLVAYVTFKDEFSCDIAELRDHLARQLPDYMVPSAFVRLDQLPLTPNGKLDRKALPAPDAAALVTRDYEAPRAGIEQTVAAIWSELLGVERVGRRDHFFELGGHSLLAVRLLSRLQSVLNVALPLAQLFANPTLSGLARAISQASVQSLPAISPVSRENPLPLSFAQQRLWFLAQLDGVSQTYHIPFGIRLTGALDRAALRASLDRVLARHEALRTVFTSHDGQPQVNLLPAASGFALIEHDLQRAPDAPQRLKQISTEEARSPFDLGSGPLIRGRLIRMADDDHVLLITQHHIVSDGWSLGVFISEISTLYRAFAAGQNDPLPPLAIQYPDYAAWQRQWLSGERLQTQADYWRRQLAHVPVLLELPSDRPRPEQQSFAGASLEVRIDAELTQGLKRLSQQHGTTLFMILLAAWAAVLARLSGQQDLVIGTPTANRSRQELEGLIGFFVNTLALRIDLSAAPTLAELIARVRQTALDAQDHQDLPFEQIVEIAQPYRSLAHTPLFQVLFAWQNNDRGYLDLSGIKLQPVRATLDAVKFDLELGLAESANGIGGSFRYATVLFDAATIERHRDYLLVVLRAMVADANQSVAMVDLLSASERELLLHSFNQTQATYPTDRCIHELFEQQVEKTPDAIAVVQDKIQLTYAELNRQANRLAHRLIAAGVTPDSRVALCVDRCPHMIVGLLAVLKAGGAYVPLDPTYPTERLLEVLSDSRPVLLLADATGYQALHGQTLELPVLALEDIARQPCTDQSAPFIKFENESNPDPRALGLTPGHLAYVIYTSGSTGKPKGVMVEHAQIARLLEATQAWYQFNEQDTWCLFHSFAFDFSVWEMWGALRYGGRLVIVSRDTARSAPAFYRLVCENRVTVLNQTPSAFRVFIEAQAQDSSPNYLRYVIFGGEALEPSILKPWYAAHSDTSPLLVNMYGITETTVHVTYRPLQKADTVHSDKPIGQRIPDLRIYLLDTHQQPVPMGAAGELYIGGDGVARGYLNRPELTAERFLSDPFSNKSHARMYRTGDLARYRTDGNLEFLGRADQQVKVRGFRIEPGEIEARLAAHPVIREAVVLAREDVPGDMRLVAYVTFKDEATCGAVELRGHLARQLPDYMVPSAFVTLDTLPLTPNGKLDRKALPAPDASALVTRTYEAPQGQVEQTLAAIWSELLGVDRVGRNDHFFELGGHSLLIVQIVERLRRVGLGIEVRALFATPRLCDLAATLGVSREVIVPPNTLTVDTADITPDQLPLIELTQRDIDDIAARVPGGVSNIQDIYALSPLQDGILFHHLLANHGDPYLLVSQMAFDNRATLDRYLAAIQQVVDRHDILRTAFHWQGLSAPAQVVWRKAPLAITEVSLDPDAGTAQEQLAHRFDPRHYSIDLAQAPLLHFFITQEPDSERWIMLQLLHHLIDDISTVQIMHSEVAAILSGKGDSLLPPQPFRNLVAQSRLGQSVEVHERFFRESLGDIEEPTLPFGLSEVHHDGSGVLEARHKLPRDLSDRLRRQARRLGVSLASLCHLAFGQMLARTSGQESVVFGTVLFGRMQAGAGADRALGLFINTLPLRLDLDATPVEQSVLDTQRRLAALLEHEHASLALAQRCSAVPAPTPLFSSLLNYRHHRPLDIGRNETASPFRGIKWLSGENRTNYPFNLSIEDFGNAIGLTAHVVDSLCPDRVCSLMQRTLDQLAALLESAPATPVRQIDVLPSAEREVLLHTWNQTQSQYPKDRCLHQIFEDQVQKTPEAVAVVQNEISLSYSELNAQANRLAHRLIAQGVKPDDRVAICSDRRPHLVVGLLAILKAGGAYVPLDPSYPADRLTELLEDSKPLLVLLDAAGRTAVTQDRIDIPCIDLDGVMHEDEHDSAAINPAPAELGLTPAHLAYVIYTSGSTGKPKGAQNEHGALVNRLTWMQSAYGLTPGDRVLQKTPFSFDVSVWEFFWTLMYGATLVLAEPGAHKDARYLVDVIRRESVTTLHFVPSMLGSFLAAEGVAACRTLRRIICSGEALPAASVRQSRQTLPWARLYNLYGPTEAAIDVTAWTCPDNFGGTTVPIGRPIANARLYLLDAYGEPVPIGAVGELYIGGAGVARGYLNRPELTAERFLEDRFCGEPGAKMYRTGDLARYQSDGTLDFLGRADQQVKIRGFRIEPGEIEARLCDHPSVRDAIVVAREDISGDKRLVAYVVRRIPSAPTPTQNVEGEAQQVKEWQALYDHVYLNHSESPSEDDFSGWNSSYDGQPIPENQMQEWRDAIVERILSLQPRNVLEIGVGSGLLLWKVAPHCASYWGTDLSASAIDGLRKRLHGKAALRDRVELRSQPAHDFNGLPEGIFDTIVLNSVIQYFPSTDYLLGVIRQAVSLLAPGGRLFIGDVRNYQLLCCFSTAVALRNSNANNDGPHLQHTIRQIMETEKELLLDPGLFETVRASNDQICGVDIQLKRGHAHNELTRYRYDVVLHKQPVQMLSMKQAAMLRWRHDVATIEDLASHLLAERPSCIRVAGIPNGRISGEYSAMLHLDSDTLEAARSRLDLAPCTERALDPEAMCCTFEKYGYRAVATLSKNSSSDHFDLLLIDSRIEGGRAITDLYEDGRQNGDSATAYANNPSAAGDTNVFVAALRQHLGRQLPDHMVPAAFVTLDALPLTTNGKLNRKALPAPDASALVTHAYEAPQGEIESALAAIWSELLGVARVGRNDHFFELGGHSLLAVRLLSRLQSVLKVALPMAQLFSHLTLSVLARAVSQASVQSLPAVSPVSRENPLPLSFSQQRLWLLAQLDGVSQTYHMPTGLHLIGLLDRFALRRSLDTIWARHEALRAVFSQRDGQPQMSLLPAAGGFTLIEHDLHQAPDAIQLLKQITAEETHAPFDLSCGPLVRGRLVRLADNDHVLLITQHHIVSDGWSMGVLFNELSTLYRAFATGQNDPLPPLTIQYPDYAAWQRQWLSGERLQTQADYWRRQLANAPALLELPTDRPRPEQQSFAGASLEVRIDAELTRGLKRLSQQHGTTLFMTLLAAWAAVLSRLSGQQDLVIGTPTANRGRQELEGLIGFFVNTLALRIDLSAAPTLAELLARVRQTALDAQDHQDLPFEQIVEIAQPHRSLAHTPLFQVMFAWQNNDRGHLDLRGLQLRPVRAPFDTAKFDLELGLVETINGIAGSFRYATALFDAATIERHRGYFLAVLRALVADANQPVTRVDLLSASERDLLLHRFNQTQAPYPADRCIHTLFEQQVEKSPDAIAIVEDDTSLTYAELNARANGLAHRLMAVGVKPGDCVATVIERSVALVTAQLAILKAGAAYVPLDPQVPADRQAWIIADCATRLVLTNGMSIDAPVPTLDVGLSSAPAIEAGNPSLRLSSEAIAYVMYTSGSTGTPKGVLVPHRAVNRLVINNGYAEFKPSDRVAFAANPAFDATTMEIWGPLLNGGCTVVINRSTLLEPQHFLKTLQTTRISVLWLTAGIFQQLAEQLSPVFRQLRILMVGGDVLDPQAIACVLQRGAPAHLLNGYGPTETTTFAATYAITECDEHSTVPIGRPIANTRLYLLDAHQQPVPLGAVGELYIGGAGVARGYLNRPELTAERFLIDPFCNESGGRLYRTGDLARYRPDGNIEFLGRIDHQVKIRGFRIEPGEIEARLSAHPLVRETVVLAREDIAGDKRLVAYVTFKDEFSCDIAELRDHLARQLPDYMVPSAFVRLDQLPLTPNGKLDRKALPAPDAAALVTRDYEAPRAGIEQTVAAIWSELLGVERVGRRDHFFELGGHSLLAVRLLSRLQSVLNVALPLAQLFANPTLSGLARAISQASVQSLPAISPVSRENPLPLSFAQQRLWFLAQLDGVSQTYHIPFGIRLTGALDRAALRASLDRVLARHEALRTVFTSHDGQPQVNLLPAASGFALIEHDLQRAPDAPQRLKQISTEEARSPFDLGSGPLIRGRLIRMADDDHVLLITQHHIVSDGWSLGVFISEISTLYRAFAAGQNDPLPPLAIQYPDYAAWQRQWLSGERLQTQADYWRRQLAHVPVLLELPSDRPRPEQQSFAGASLEVRIDAELTQGLKRLSQQHGTTLFMILLAAWAAVLARLSGQQDLVIGTPTANRSRQELEGLIGFFVNTLALRIDLSAAPTLAELIARVRQTALDAQDHQDLPFEQIVEIAQPYRSLAHTPLFQVLFAWQNNDRGYLDLSGIKLQPVRATLDAVKFDLELGLAESANGIGGSFRYATVLFDAATIERHRDYLLVVLRAMVADANQSVAMVDLLSASERELLLHSFNQTQATYPTDRCIHELFEQQVEKTPDAIAVVQDKIQLTYAELNRQANRLAHYLITQGIGPGQIVAVAYPRSSELIVTLFAILKAGAAYLPLDPESPTERSLLIVRSANVAFIIGARTIVAGLSGAAPVLSFEDLQSVLVRGHDHDANPTNHNRAKLLFSHHLAYIIYTSGSTGEPKGVMIDHRGALNTLIDINNRFNVANDDAVLGLSRSNFDLSVYDIFGVLGAGGTLVLAGMEDDRNPEAWLHAVTTHRISIWNTVPALLQLLVDYCEAHSTPLPLRLVMLSGDWIPLDLPGRLKNLAPHSEFYSLGGATEVSIWSVFYPVREIDPNWQSIPYGRALANQAVYVLDSAMHPVPLGAVGELYIGGDGVARGYLNRPELTAERFLKDPFCNEPGGRMYRTGDLARYRPDGNIEFLGRADHQVKIRGFRIEPGEIEARLAAHPLVREAVVLAREDVPGDKRLVAYVTFKEEAGCDAAELREHLVRQLPDYMVPSAFVTLGALPLTPNGKLDRKALPAPDASALVTRAYEAPHTGTEQTLAAIWSELLGVERIGRHDHFFELGGHSLLAVRLLSRLQSVLKVALPLAQLFAQPTLSSLAQAVSRASIQALPAISPVSRDLPLPLSFAQQRLWFLAQLNGVSQTYHMPFGMQLSGPLDDAAWQRSLNAIWARHEALRTVFTSHDGQPQVSLLAAAQGFTLIEHDLRQAPDASESIKQITIEEAQAPFDLSRGPLIRGRLIRLAAEEHVFLFTQHHIVSDGWSMGIFINELSTLYRAFAAGQNDPLPPLAIQYPDYAAWQRQWLSGERLQVQADYWRRQLAEVPVLLELPMDRPRPEQQSYVGASLGIRIDAELTQGLKRLSQQHGTTLFMTLLAAWAAVLSRLSSQQDLVIGTPTANRGRQELEGLIGFFVNTLALRIDLSAAPTLAELIARVRQTALDAQDHQDLPFEQVVEIAQPHRSLAHTPLFQVMFAWQNNDRARLDLPGSNVRPANAASETVKFDLELNLAETVHGIAGSFSYATALFDTITIERHCGYFLAVLKAMVADANQSVAMVDLLSASERELLLHSFNQTQATYPTDRCIHELFEQQVEKTPDAIAVVQDKIQLTYAELNRQANRLAHRLIAAGVTPDSRVALCVDRCPHMIVGLLAVLKAGGAYVPLDPTYPQDRLLEVLADAQPVLLLVDEAGRRALGSTVPAELRGLSLDEPLPALQGTDASKEESNPDPHTLGLISAHLAYVIFTSGSTGKPKGVMVEHGNTVNFLQWARLTFSAQETAHTLFSTSVNFDLSVYECFLPLSQGSTLHLVDDALALTRTPQDVSIINTVPSAAAALLGANALPASVHTINLAGEPLKAALVEELFRNTSAQRLCNLYGPSETTTYSTWLELRPGHRVVESIGRPISNTRIYLMDAHGQPVPLGSVGELYIGGAGVARGYLNRAELTAERFLKDPFCDEPGGRMYRTGDLARYWPDGNLEFLGRADHQVKIRGFRIEPGEIEARLCEHSSVRDAIVLAREDVPGDKRLVAYVIFKGEATGDVAELREHLACQLPGYMVPAAFVRLDRLPLTPNGKLDRKALPAPDANALVTRAYEAPRGEIESVVADIWSDLLGVERIGRHDHFFELGGHSLMAIQMIERLRGKGIRLELRTLFAEPTLAALSRKSIQLEEVLI